MDYLAHHGILGQKWGVRRYQNSDGSLTQEGRIRYGVGEGRKYKSSDFKNIKSSAYKYGRKFTKDAINDLHKNERSIDEEKYFETLRKWGATAENNGFLDPDDRLSIYNLTKGQNEDWLMGAIYENMPTVLKRTDERARQLVDNADEYKSKRINELDRVLDEEYPTLHEELGTKQGKDTRNYLMDSAKGLNEGDVDRVLEQHMDMVPLLYYEGKVSKEVFDKYYDGQAAEYMTDWLHMGLDVEHVKDYHNWYEQIHNDSVNHFDYDDDELYHHGTKGQKWYKRRYQYENGSLTPEGREHYGVGAPRKKVDRYHYNDESLTKAGKKKYGKGYSSPYYDEQRNLTEAGKQHYKGDTVISKGSKTYRVALDTDDPTYANRKYVSLDKEDHKKWQDSLGYQYGMTGRYTRNLNYVTMNDLKIAGDDAMAKTFIDKTMKSVGKKTYMKDLEAVKSLDQTTDLSKLNEYEYTNKVASMMVARETETGKQFIKDLQEAGYSGMKDVHGRNTSVDPTIIFNPDENIKQKGYATYNTKQYTKAANDRKYQSTSSSWTLSGDELDKYLKSRGF